MSDIIFVEERNVHKIQTAIIIQGVNCSGGYGAGFSGFLAKKFPNVEKEYRAVFSDGQVHPEYLGAAILVEVDSMREVYVLNGFTQNRFASYTGEVVASPMAIQQVLNEAIRLAKIHDVDIYMPKIGAGLGGLDWERDVLPLVETAASKALLDDVFFYVVEKFS